MMDPYNLSDEKKFHGNGRSSVLERPPADNLKGQELKNSLRDSLSMSICNSRGNRSNLGIMSKNSQSLSPSKNNINQTNGKMILNLNPTLISSMMRNGNTTNTNHDIRGSGDFFRSPKTGS